jgi:type III secretion system low calcium response chaperone LcrH/SycD
MKGENEIKKAIEGVGANIEKTLGEGIDGVSRDMLKGGSLPKDTLGMSDQMVEGIYGQAYRLYNSGKYREAVQLFRLLIMLNATESKYTLGLAASFHMLKDYRHAVETYTLCAILDTESPVPHYHAADCFIQMGDLHSAIVTLDVAIKRAASKPQYQVLKDRSLMTLESLKKEIGQRQKQAISNLSPEG